MREKDVQRVLEAAYAVTAGHTTTTSLAEARDRLAATLREVDPHRVYERKPLHIDAANAQTGEELEPKLRACPRLSKAIGEPDNLMHD